MPLRFSGAYPLLAGKRQKRHEVGEGLTIDRAWSVGADVAIDLTQVIAGRASKRSTLRWTRLWRQPRPTKHNQPMFNRLKNPCTPGRAGPPSWCFELLEARQVLSALPLVADATTTNAAYVESVYQDVFGRQADPIGLEWGMLLATAVSAKKAGHTSRMSRSGQTPSASRRCNKSSSVTGPPPGTAKL